MALHRLDHYNIHTSIPDETVRFYCDVLGCTDGAERRPDFGSPGTWLLVGDHPAIHLNFVEADAAGSTGAFNHIAFEADGYLATQRELDDHGIDYDTAELPQSDLMQIFLKDPNQVRLELNFRGEAEAIAAERGELG